MSRTLRALWLPVLAAFVAGVLSTLLVTAVLRDNDPRADVLGSPLDSATPPTSVAPAATAIPGSVPATTAPAAALSTTTSAAVGAAGVAAEPRVQWETFEVNFEAADDHPWSSFPLQVVFEHPASSTEIVVDGFWDGGRTWRVRFVPMLAGDWRWQSSSVDVWLDGHNGSLTVSEPSPDAIAVNANYRGHLEVADGGRHLERADGSPFFFLGDTGWWFNSTRCPLEPSAATGGFRCADYFDDRVDKGFSVIGVEMFDIHNANEGGFPFPCNAGDNRGNGDYSCLNADHFRQLDVRMRQLWERGLVAYANVSWLVGQLPNEHTTPDDAKVLGQYIMARYAWMPMVFSLSGEYQYGYDAQGVRWSRADWNDYGAHMARHNPQGHPITIHPSSSGHWETDNPGSGGQSSAGEFHQSDWLDLNSIQSGHQVAKLELNPRRVSEAVALEPAKPVLHAEGYYLENILNREPVTDGQLRWQAYVPLLNGALGHMYGANGIWQMYSGGTEADYPELRDTVNTRPWWDVMTHPSSIEVGRTREFFEEIVGDWWVLTPHRDWLDTAGRDYRDGKTDPHLAATAGASTIVVFFGELQPATARTEAVRPSLASRAWAARWFDPRTGDLISGGRVTADADGVLRFPDRPFAGDWALVLSEVPA